MLGSLKRGLQQTQNKLIHNQIRGFAKQNQKVVCALYPGGYAGQNNPNILGCVENELGLRKYIEDLGHTLVVTSVNINNIYVILNYKFLLISNKNQKG